MLVAITLIIVVLDRQNPFFLQIRIGKNGKPFKILKFRTLRTKAQRYMLKPPDDDPVITPAGRIIRKRGLDELTQLFNVLKGDMALVGPRPEMGFIVEGYTPTEKMRLAARPGLTGLWQLSRVRDRAIHHHIEYDLFYINNKSLGLDLWLVWRSALFAVFKTATKIRLAVKRWERRKEWRRLVPERAGSIPPRTGPLLSTIWWASAGTAVLLVAVPAVGASVNARRELLQAQSAMLAAERAFRSLQPKAAAASLTKAAASLHEAEQELESFLLLPARQLPAIKENLAAVDALIDAGRSTVEAGHRARSVLESLPVSGRRLAVPINDGKVNLAPLSQGRQPALRMQKLVAGAQEKVRSAASDLLLPPVSNARKDGLRALNRARRQADAAAAASYLLPRLLGAEGPRTTLLGAENPAELRGRGGYIGSIGSIRADSGILQLSDFVPTETLPPLPDEIRDPSVPPEYRGHLGDLGALDAWQNLGMSPDFPSGAKVLLTQLAKSAGIHAEALISLDPVGLSYLLEVTGPIRVPGVPEILTAENLVEWSLNRIYFQYADDNDQRRQVLARASGLVWQKLMSGKQLDPAQVARALGRALSERHMVVYSSVPREQTLIESLGISGMVDPAPGDYLLVVGQNMGENKMDYYMRRRVDLEGRITPDGSMEATVQVTLSNTAAAGTALPDYIGGPRAHLGLDAGEARTYLTAYLPPRASVSRVMIDGSPATYDTGIATGKRFVASSLEVGAGKSQRFTFEYRIPQVMEGSRYTLTVQKQAVIRSDQLLARIHLPDKAKIGFRSGFSRGEVLAWRGPLTSDRELSAQLQIPVFGRWTDKVVSVFQRPVLSLP